MEDIVIKILAFLLAIGILVSVHEFGHFWVARRLGVKVLRFSIGFGKPLLQWRGQQDQTEYVLAAIPLGGYVKMLDEREQTVEQAEQHRAFNRQSLKVRSAIVAAGPAFNFLFAVVAFWIVLMMGETGLKPLVGEVQPDSIAQRAGFISGDQVTAVNGRETVTWSMVLQELASASVSDQAIEIEVIGTQQYPRRLLLAPGSVGDLAEIPDLLQYLGMRPQRPQVPPVFGRIVPGEPAAEAGIQTGDRIVQADGVVIDDWTDWVDYVRARPEQPIDLIVQRDAASLALSLTPAAVSSGEQTMGRIGAANQPADGLFDEYRVEYRLGPLQAFSAAVGRTFEYSVLTLKVIWRIFTGQASVNNLSGPFTIADTAGKTASYGLVYFLKFLAVVSISLGVLNLLPVPVLDGGHLVFFALEAVRGSPVPETWMIEGQRIGLIVLAGLMGLAFYVDLQRFFG